MPTEVVFVKNEVGNKVCFTTALRHFTDVLREVKGKMYKPSINLPLTFLNLPVKKSHE
jgi:adenosyl cobinamide kinase/adenosyl cobinamide phosphate guanylyltransferase